MPKITSPNLNQLNPQIDKIDVLRNQLADLQTLVKNIGFQSTISDPVHAPTTTNNLSFTWTGSTTSLSWNPGFIKTKNATVQTTSRPAIKSSAPGQKHNFSVLAGSLTLSPSTYYWIGWNFAQNQMVATQDASSLHSDYNVHIICQLYTGTSGQTGTAGGGGSSGGSDLSGARYKLF